MKRNSIELLKMVAAALLFAAAVLFIGFQVSQSQKIAENTRIEQESRLSIAIVNEDQGAEFEGQSYQLGKSYVNHLSQNDNNSWTVLGRNAAETGLNSGDYQLVVYIPGNFSKKIVDINAVTPNQATVTYKVNAKGNATVENMANQVGNQIVTDLDQQLVGVFMASILDNLYQAQRNVQKVVDTQAVNIGDFQTNILGTAVNFRNNLPNLIDAARNSGTVNNSLIDGLTNSVSLFDSLAGQQDDYSRSLTDLMQQREAGTISYGDFMAQLLTMTNLIGQTQGLYSQIKANQTALTANFAEDDPATDVVEQTGALKTALKSLEGQVSAATASAGRELVTHYGLATAEEAAAMSAEDVDARLEEVKLKDLVGTDWLNEEKDKLEKQRDEAKDKRAAKEAELAKNIKTGVIGLPEAYEGATVAVKANSPGITVLTDDFTYSNQQGHKNAYSYYVTSPQDSAAGSHDITITVTPVKTATQTGLSATGSRETVVNLTSESSSTSSSTDSSASSSSSTTDPAVGTDPATTPGSSSEAPKSSDPATVADGTITIHATADYSDYTSEEYMKLVANYNNLEGQVEALEKPLDQSVGSYLKTVVASVLGNSMGTLTNPLENLKNQVAAVETQAQTVTSDIDSLLAEYEALTAQVATVQEAGSKDQTSQSETTSALSALAPAFSSLTSASATAKSSSESNVTSAQGVRDMLGNFENDIARAESTTDNLETDANSLSEAFSQELANNQDFVGSFVKVLNNAYNNGVPNEELLKFLSNPIKEEAQASRATANVYKPFTWVLLIAMIALFVAYVFNSSQVFQTTLNKFAQSENAFLRAGSKTVIVSQMLTLIIGLLVGVVSFNQLQISASYSVLWVFSIIVMTMFLAQWIYLGLRHLKTVGMGIALFVLVSYIYLTSAVGNTAVLSGFPLVLRRLNILSVFEGLLSGFFVSEPVALWQIFLIILGLATGLTLGIFARPKKVEEEE